MSKTSTLPVFVSILHGDVLNSAFPMCQHFFWRFASRHTAPHPDENTNLKYTNVENTNFKKSKAQTLKRIVLNGWGYGEERRRLAKIIIFGVNVFDIPVTICTCIFCAGPPIFFLSEYSFQDQGQAEGFFLTFQQLLRGWMFRKKSWKYRFFLSSEKWLN